MKIYLPNFSNTKIGGGFSFLKNFINALLSSNSTSTENVNDADAVLISSATMVTRDQFSEYKSLNRKIVLRVDGVPEDWRNRGTGWSRLKEFAQNADLVIFQSEFSQKTTGRLIGELKNTTVIYNGIDTDVFKPDGEKFPEFGKPSLLYCNYRKGEHNKRVEETIERFRQMKLDFPQATITFVGDYPKEQFFWNEKDWDFGMLDLVNAKDWQYLGIISDREKLAKTMRSCQYIAFPSFADPCPNTLIEAMCCGCQPLWLNDYGGQKEIADKFFEIDWSYKRMVNEYLYVMKAIL